MNHNDLRNIMFSPKWTSTLIHHFISGYGDSKQLHIDILFLVLPFVYDERIRKKLSTLNKTSTFRSAFNDEKIQICILDKPEQYNEYKAISKEAIIYLGNIEKVDFGFTTSVNEFLDFSKETNKHLKEYKKAAHYLGVIFSKEDLNSLFRKLKVVINDN